MTDTTATTQPKTTAEKLNAARAVVAKLERQLAAEAIKNDILVDDVVTFSYGRGDKRRDLNGKVVAIKNGERGMMVRILTGEGFDAETLTIHVNDVIANPAADARRNDTQPVTTPLVDDGSDPLNVA